MEVSFLGLGQMGEPMSANLVRGGVPLIVWNRSEPALARSAAIGASVAASARSAMRSAQVVLLMLANEAALDEVLERGSAAFGANVFGRLIVHMGTTSPEYSVALSDAIRKAGGRYVEAPVSGSRVPAERGTLIGMVAGTPADVAVVRKLLRPVCKQTFACGEVPKALAMKLAVNLFLITMVTGLVEASHFAAKSHLDLALFRSILEAGPMASDVSTIKLAKLVEGDLTPQASLSDVLMNSELIVSAAGAAQISTPLVEQAYQLYLDAAEEGHGALDMVGVLRTYESLTCFRRMKEASS